MKVHANAALGPAGRLALVQAIESGMTQKAALQQGYVHLTHRDLFGELRLRQLRPSPRLGQVAPELLADRLQ